MEFHTATNLDDALSVLGDRGDEATVIAGGTDVMVQIGNRELDTGFLLHIERVAELQGITLDAGLRIGALTTHREIATSPLVTEHFPGLAEAAAQVGGWQTQSVGTIGGNICNASPAADLMAPLLVQDARVVLHSRDRGEREIPLEEFVTGRRSTTLESDELLTSVVLNLPTAFCSDVYFKVGRRGATEIAILGLAVRLFLDDDMQRIKQARIASCSTGPVATRCAAAEAILSGSDGLEVACTEAGAALLSSVSNIDDIRATARYRDLVLPALLGRAVSACMERVRSA